MSGEEPIIAMIYPQNIELVWPFVIPVLAQAIAICGTHDPDDVKKSLLMNHSQLWVQYKDKKIEAATVTELVPYPKGTWLRVWLAGVADKAKILRDKFQAEIMGFYQLNNCVGMEVWARKGFVKLYPKAQNELVILRWRL